MKGTLTNQQRLVFSFIKGYIAKHGFPPTVREIGAEFSWTPNGVKSHVDRLVNKGWISRIPNAARAIKIL